MTDYLTQCNALAADNNEWKCLTSREPTYAAALAEANRIAGGA